MTAVRATLLLAAGTAGGIAAWTLGRGPAATVLAPLLEQDAASVRALSFEDVLLGACAAALVSCALWLVATGASLTVCYVVRDLLPTSARAARACRTAEQSCPFPARQLVAVALGVAATTGLAAPTLADDRGPLGGLRLPDRTTGAAAGATASETGPRQHPGIEASRSAQAPPAVTVRPGDSLWSIGAALLPRQATDVDISVAWHRLYRSNRDRIGRDPDLILPGTRLVVPVLPPHPRKDSP